jgi:hypothetical protein
LVVCGYVTAVVVPVVGFVLGIILLVKGRVAHGVGVVLLSVFMTFFWAGFIPAFEAGFKQGYSHHSP